MVRRNARALALVALIGLVAGALGGCWNPFAPDDGGGGGGDPIEWKPRTSPANVLHNLQTAYKNKMVDEYLDCMAEDFVFLLNPKDVENDPTLEPGYWGKAEERLIHQQMFGDEGEHADRIELRLTQVGDPLPVNPGDGTGTHYQYKEAVDLKVYMGVWTYLATAPSMYQFRIDQDQVGPDGEQLWEIWRWQDLDETRGSISSDETTRTITVGQLKAMFRP